MSVHKLTVGRVICYILLVGLALVFLIPFIWMFCTSIKERKDAFNINVWIPSNPQWSSYSEMFNRIPILTYLKNTLIIAALPIIGEVLSAPMIAYSLAKIPWKGGKYLFPLILATMMIPWQVTQVPLFITYSKLGLVNTFVPLVLPAFFGAPYYIYLMRQFIKGIPDSLMEAARIDGASEIRILYTIVYPLCRPALTTTIILCAIGSWNDLNGPLLYLQDSSKYVISIASQTFLQNARSEYNLLMALGVMTTLPLIILFFIAQKQFIKGISTTGLK